MAGASKRKAMEQDVDTDDLEERAMMQQPRSRFSELEPSADQGTAWLSVARQVSFATPASAMDCICS